jgi:hypothetical protein
MSTPKSTTTHGSLQDVFERHRTVSELAELLWSIAIVLTRCQLALPLRVDSLVVENQHKKRDYSCSNEAKLQRMSKNIARSIWGTIEVRSHRSGKVTYRNLNSLTSCTLGGSSQI